MPDASHTIDRLMAAREPARKLVRGETTLSRLLVRRALRNPWHSFGSAAAVCAGVAVIGNMMLLQPERHRSPMFVGNPVVHSQPQPSLAPLPPQRPATLDRDTEASRRVELIRELQVELAQRGFFSAEADGIASPRTTQAIREFQTAANLPVTGQPTDALLAEVLVSQLRAKDQILNMLKTTTDRLSRPDTVAATQRALSKLGYGPLPETGQFGPATRAALDKFEKDRKLPGRGENPTRVLRELSQASGIAIN